jgi:hypothetical protein
LAQGIHLVGKILQFIRKKCKEEEGNGIWFFDIQNLKEYTSYLLVANNLKSQQNFISPSVVGLQVSGSYIVTSHVFSFCGHAEEAALILSKPLSWQKK